MVVGNSSSGSNCSVVPSGLRLLPVTRMTDAGSLPPA